MESDSSAAEPRSDTPSTSEEAPASGAVGETVALAEKVRFWQEQDRINRALIPRVVALHEELVRLGRTLEGVSDRLEAVEARAAEAEAAVPVAVGERTAGLRTLLDETVETTSALESSLGALQRYVESEAEREAERAALHRRLRQNRWLTLVALALALAALLVAAL